MNETIFLTSGNSFLFNPFIEKKEKREREGGRKEGREEERKIISIKQRMCPMNLYVIKHF